MSEEKNRSPISAVFPTDVFGTPMREYAPGKWETAVWPSDKPKPTAYDDFQAQLESVRQGMLALGQNILLGYTLDDEDARKLRQQRLEEILGQLNPILINFENQRKAGLSASQRDVEASIEKECLRIYDEGLNFGKAVLYYRSKMGTGLIEAKDAVDRLIRSRKSS